MTAKRDKATTKRFKTVTKRCKMTTKSHKTTKGMQNNHIIMKSTSKRHKMATKRLCFFQSACLVLMQEGYRKLLSHNSTVAVVYEELQIANI